MTDAETGLSQPAAASERRGWLANHQELGGAKEESFLQLSEGARPC